MTLTGFAFLIPLLLAEIARPLGDTMAALAASWWTVPFVMLVLSFPSGHLTSCLDRLIV